MLLLTAINEFKWFAILSVVDTVFLLLFTVLFVLVGGYSVNGALTTMICQGFLSTIVTLMFFVKRHNVHFVKLSIARLWEMFNYGIRFHIGKASNFANINMGTIVATFFLSKEEVGMFAVASQTIARTMIIPDTLATVLLPKVASENDDMRKEVARLTRLTGIFTATMLACFAILAKPFVIIFFSPAFLPAVPIIQILAIGITVRSTSKVFEPYLLGIGFPGRVSVSSIVTLMANFFLAWFFLSIWGLKGVAVGTTLAYFCGAYVLLQGFIKYSKIGFIETFTFTRSDSNLIWSWIPRSKKI
jgi:PST family polysaccharide transporter